MNNIIIKVPSVYTAFLPQDDNHPPSYVNLATVQAVEFFEEKKIAHIWFVSGDFTEFTGLRAITLWQAMSETNGVNPQVEAMEE